MWQRIFNQCGNSTTSGIPSQKAKWMHVGPPMNAIYYQQICRFMLLRTPHWNKYFRLMTIRRFTSYLDFEIDMSVNQLGSHSSQARRRHCVCCHQSSRHMHLLTQKLFGAQLLNRSIPIDTVLNSKAISISTMPETVARRTNTLTNVHFPSQ